MAIQQALEQRRLREERKQSEREIRAQLVELQRWHEAMLSREERILELKTEVNELLAQQQKPARYAVIPPP
jgi:DNA-binding protein H-NS